VLLLSGSPPIRPRSARYLQATIAVPLPSIPSLACSARSNECARVHEVNRRRLAQNGLTAYSIAKRRGLEGIVVKDSDAPMKSATPAKWLKVNVRQEEECVIGGFTAPVGAPKQV